MIVRDFDFVRIATTPNKADAPLVVNANRILTSPIAFQLFETISGRRPQVLK
jgi:hypothetical protein